MVRSGAAQYSPLYLPTTAPRGDAGIIGKCILSDCRPARRERGTCGNQRGALDGAPSPSPAAAAAAIAVAVAVAVPIAVAVAVAAATLAAVFVVIVVVVERMRVQEGWIKIRGKRGAGGWRKGRGEDGIEEGRKGERMSRRMTSSLIPLPAPSLGASRSLAPRAPAD